MESQSRPQGGDLFIVDNSDQDWKVRRYLQDWADLAQSLDVATGYFEVGGLLTLEGQWQKLDRIRILMGDEISRRTQKALLAGVQSIEQKLDLSLEKEKEKNDFLAGVPAIVDAIRKGQIVCRVYTKEKFHAKAYITHAKQAVVGSSALVGSSNFTFPGLNDNIELNVQLRREVDVLQAWFERHWNDASDISPEILRVIERQTALYPPFFVYARALHEFFQRHEMTDDEWLTSGPEAGGSKVYPILDYYQQEGFHELVGIAEQYHGAFLCDGVGLGKTFIGLMLIESLIKRHRKRVALFVPKAARKPVWENKIREHLPELLGPDYSNLAIYNHTDLLRRGDFPQRIKRIKELADVIVVDEAHHFRNPGIRGEDPSQPESHYWSLANLCAEKDVYLLTATPVNNRLIDLQHMIELFTQRKQDYFKAAPLGIHSLSGHFRKMEKELERRVSAQEHEEEGIETNQVEAEQVLSGDALFRALVVQRSRAYVKKSQEQHASTAKAIFPTREPPKVVNFNLKKTYGHLLEMIEQAFNKQKPLFSLAIYYPLAYYKGPDTEIKPLEQGRQKEVVSLIRVQFLKRFESSARAFELSCATLMEKLMAWLIKHCETDHEKHRLEKWKTKYADLIGYCKDRQMELFGGESEEDDEDIIPQELLEAVEKLPRDEYRVEEIIDETIDDLHTIAEFLQELQKFKVSQDDKLKALIKLLKSDPVLKKHKVLIFTEYMATARYLKQQLAYAGFTAIDEIDSKVDRDRGEIINQFAPYYNDLSSQALKEQGLEETRILISTDVLSEGLNLQDATRVINYDLHWNPVRLMQRIGRVDRRMHPKVEAAIIADHPDQAAIRGKVGFWNFLPPDELDELLHLYSRVSHKVLRISRVFGIEGKKLLTPEDDFEALKDFTHAYEGTTSPLEEMNLEYQKLLEQNPGLAKLLDGLPGRLFSGKKHPAPDSRAVFFCFAMPSPPPLLHDGTLPEDVPWTTDGGATHWYLYDLESGTIADNPAKIIDKIRCAEDTPRKHDIPEQTLSEVRGKIEKHIKNTYLKQVQAPIGVKPVLKAWMELS